MVDSVLEGEYGGLEGREEVMDFWIVCSVESCIWFLGIIVFSVVLFFWLVGIV